MRSYSLWALCIGGSALLVALGLYLRVRSAPEGTSEMSRIASYIRQGAMAFLAREYRVLALYALCVSGALFFGFGAQGLGAHAALAFVLGAGLSLLSGFLGMKAATYGNVRTTEAARAHGRTAALVMALDGGAVMGLCVAGLGLLGLGSVCFLFAAGDAHVFATVLHAFAVGASSIALFARIGGGRSPAPTACSKGATARPSRSSGPARASI